MLRHSLKKVLARREIFSARRHFQIATNFFFSRRALRRDFVSAGARRGGGGGDFFFREFFILERAGAVAGWN